MVADQVVAFRGQIREKPECEAECRMYLKSYEDEPACTVTAVVITNTATGKQVSGVDIAKQWFLPIPDDIVSRVLSKGDIMYCSGGFMVCFVCVCALHPQIDDPDFAPYLARREGSEDSIIGMPLELTSRLLAEAQDSL